MLISFQVAGMIIIFILVSFFLAQTRLTLKSGRLFLLVCFVTFILLFLDIFSIICIMNPNVFAKEVIDFFSKLYLVFLVIESSFGLVYLARDIYKYRIKARRIFYVTHMLYLITSAILLLSTNIVEVYDKENHILYTEGTSCLICYILSGILLLLTIFYVVIYRKYFNKANRDTIIIWMIFWIIAAATQFFNKQLLVVGFASAAALIIIYINLENPALIIDKKTAKFNFELLEECITELNDKNIDYKVVYMILNNNAIDNNSKNSALMAISNVLSTFSNTKIYATRNKFLTFKGEFGFVNILINTNTEEFFDNFNLGMKNINYNKLYNNVFDIKYLIIENSFLIKNYEYLKNLFDSILEKNLISLNNKINYIDSYSIEKIEEIYSMEKTLNYALEHDLIDVYYQPIYSTKDKSFTSAEALLRIKDKEGKMYYPQSLIEIAERNGTISKLGEIVFIKVCQFLKEHNIRNLGIHYVEVNLSVVQCGNHELADNFISIMKKYDIDPSLINLEITETASSNLRKIMLKNMNKLIEYGVSFSLDDFGMGNSNLNYIIEMPVEIIKFDRTLVNSYFNDEKAKVVFNKVIEMIKSLNFSIVFEGIEEEKDFKESVNIGIDYIQGYYFSKPVPGNEFIEFLKEHNK